MISHIHQGILFTVTYCVGCILLADAVAVILEESFTTLYLSAISVGLYQMFKWISIVSTSTAGISISFGTYLVMILAAVSLLEDGSSVLITALALSSSLTSCAICDVSS